MNNTTKHMKECIVLMERMKFSNPFLNLVSNILTD